jgi:hypothetical protein
MFLSNSLIVYNLVKLKKKFRNKILSSKSIIFIKSIFYLDLCFFGIGKNEIAFSLSSGSTSRPFVNIFYNIEARLESSQALELNKWYHLAFTIKNNIMYIYIDGILINSKPFTPTYSYVSRNLCYFGRSLWGDPYPDTDIDDIRIYKIGLSQNEIANTM